MRIDRRNHSLCDHTIHVKEEVPPFEQKETFPSARREYESTAYCHEPFLSFFHTMPLSYAFSVERLLYPPRVTIPSEVRRLKDSFFDAPCGEKALVVMIVNQPNRLRLFRRGTKLILWALSSYSYGGTTSSAPHVGSIGLKKRGHPAKDRERILQWTCHHDSQVPLVLAYSRVDHRCI